LNHTKKRWNLSFIYYVSISFLGLLILLLMIIWISPSNNAPNYHNPVIFLVFFSICFLGLIAALYPRICSKPFYLGVNEKLVDYSMEFKGHHPVCGEFTSHIFNWHGKDICAGCTGLVIGAILAMIGSIVYYIYGNLNTTEGQLVLALGLGIVLFSLLQIFFLKIQKNQVKLFSSMTLVIGSLLILIGINTLNNSVYIEFYFLMLILFWILARITLSHIDHETICRNCRMQSSCPY